LLSLIGRLGLALLIGIVDNLTWDYRAYYNLPGNGNQVSLVGSVFLAILNIIMLGLAWLAYWRMRRKSPG